MNESIGMEVGGMRKGGMGWESGAWDRGREGDMGSQ